MSHHIHLQRAMICGEGGQHSTMVSKLASGPSCTRFDSQHSQKKFRGKIIDVAEINQRGWLEESGQWLENVDPTHLVQASGKPVLQKMICGPQTATVLNLS